MSAQHSRTTSSSDETRQHIINSIFSKSDEDGTPEETLISYVKVYEEEPGAQEVGPKTRYLMLAGEFSAHFAMSGGIDYVYSDKAGQGSHP